MRIAELVNRNNDLKELVEVYERLYLDEKKSLYKSKLLQSLIKSAKKEIEGNEELIYENTLGGEQ